MKKTSFIKKVTALSLCAVLVLPVVTTAAEGPARETTAEELTEGMTGGRAAGVTAEESSGLMSGEETAGAAVMENAEEAMTEGESVETATEESSGSVSGGETAETAPTENSEETMTEGESAETATEESSGSVPGEGTAEAAVTENAEEAATEKETDDISSAEKGTGTGYMLKHFTIYNDGEVTMDVDSLKAELDFAKKENVSGVRLLVDSGGTEAGYIAISYMDGTVLIVLHGGLSGQTVKYKINSETLTTILDSDDFNLFLRGAMDNEVGAGSDFEDQETERLTEDSITEQSEMESETEGTETEPVSPEEESEEPETNRDETEESESGETEPETSRVEAEEPESGETELETNGVGTEESELGETELETTGVGTEESELGETESETNQVETEESESGEAEPETNGAAEPNSNGLMINGLSLTSFVKLVNEAYLLINEGAVRNEEVESDQGTFHRSGIVLNRKHMKRLLEICSEMGIDGGVKKRLEAQNIQPEGGAILWGTDGEDYRAIAGSFGVSVGDEAPVWNAFGADIVGKELTIYNYRMPEQQTMEIKNGVEIVFSMTEPEGGAEWVPADDTDAIDLAELEPAEAIDEISTDIQMVLYDMMGGVLSVVLEEMPEEMVSDMLGLESQEEAMSESESETDFEEMEEN